MAYGIGTNGLTETSDERRAREIARRNRDQDGRPLSPVMKTAITARELARSSQARTLQK